ncbi:hypothetical protein N431DRAFT_34908 [Stipitochalara longipes BDJ]|nr:hypothetical protein N431DRAFT_34908 [Stipitochalara longipes BDJ]
MLHEVHSLPLRRSTEKRKTGTVFRLFVLSWTSSGCSNAYLICQPMCNTISGVSFLSSYTASSRVELSANIEYSPPTVSYN